MKPNQVEEKILGSVEEAAAEQVAFVTRLVRVKSLPGTKQEGEAQKVFKQMLAKVKHFSVDVWEPEVKEVNRYPLHPIRETKDNWNYAQRPNVVGVIEGESKRSLILNGHVDVVSEEPRSAWTKDPWRGQVIGERLYGRGANDMKAGLSCILFAAKAVVDSGYRPEGNLIVQSVVEEEFGGGGSISALQRGYTASAAIVAEPTGSRNICIGSGGSRFFRVKVRGKAHTPQLSHQGVNAIDAGYKIHRALATFNERRQKRLKGKVPSFEKTGEGVMFGDGKPTNLVVGRFKAGDFPATVAGFAELEGRFGFPKGEVGKVVKRELEKAVTGEAKKDSWMRRNPPTVEWFNAQREPYQLTKDEPIVLQLGRSITDVLRTSPMLFATPSSADAVFFANRMGKVGGIPTVMYGPGGLNAHSADEFVYLKDVVECTKVLALLIMRWCGYREVK